MVRDKFISLLQPSTPAITRKLAYREWGDPASNRVIVCVHGLSRNARDFDRLAEKLSASYRVICPDMAGRGESEWLTNKNDYNYITYASDVVALLMQLRIPSVDWIGTSMGGIIGIMLAAQNPALIKRMVINDIGSIVSAEGLKRILGFVGAKSAYDSKPEAMEALRYYLAPFGITDESDWDFMLSVSFKPQTNGQYKFNYDPDLSKTFREAASAGGAISDVDLTAFWSLVKCPVLILRGEKSDILSHATAQTMLKRPFQTKLVEFPGVGHAPALLSPAQINTITEWLA